MFALKYSVHFSSVTFHHQAHKENYCFRIKIWDCSTWEWQCCTYSTKLLVFQKTKWLAGSYKLLYLTDLPIRHLILKEILLTSNHLTLLEQFLTLMEKYSSEERSNISLQLPLRILNLFLFFLGGGQLNKNAFYLWCTNTTSSKIDHFSPMIQW